MDRSSRKHPSPTFTWTYAALSSLVLIVGCPRQCLGGIVLNVLSPQRNSPHVNNSEAQCNFWHDAVEGEPVHFAATATFERQLDFTIMVSYDDDFVPFSGCPVEYCSYTRSCTMTCVATVPATSGSRALLFKVTASPYDLRIGDTVVSICISVEARVTLLLAHAPKANITVAQGETVTIRYVAQGYPRPIAYVLECEGRTAEENQNGTFKLSNLPVGRTVCNATASNGIEAVRSTPTEILVLAAAANVSSSGRRLRGRRIGGKCVVFESLSRNKLSASGGHTHRRCGCANESDAARAAVTAAANYSLTHAVRLQLRPVANAPSRLDDGLGRRWWPERCGVGDSACCRAASDRWLRRTYGGERTPTDARASTRRRRRWWEDLSISLLHRGVCVRCLDQVARLSSRGARKVTAAFGGRLLTPRLASPSRISLVPPASG